MTVSPWLFVAAAVIGYAFGSINPASLFARARGIDLKDVGSGNPGATNASRAMGKKMGVLIALLDVLKGFIPALAFSLIYDPAGELAGFAAVVGHITSPFLRGRGGKGVATTLGAVMGAQPIWTPFLLAGFAVGYLATRRVGIGAVCGAVVLIIVSLFAPGVHTTIFGIAMGLLIIVRHYKNLGAAWRDWPDLRKAKS
ncbi:MAG: glycerol-3-phosphate acyltransferase [Actinobacteria bacterium]|nr:glycerol-3-phosphate acyltransferase [Actinomycetota bacterium]